MGDDNELKGVENRRMGKWVMWEFLVKLMKIELLRNYHCDSPGEHQC